MPLTPRQTFIGGSAPGGVFPAPHAASHEIGGSDAVTPTLIGAMPASLSVTGYTGGGGANLDGVATVGLAVPQLFSFVHATDNLRTYLLRAGTDAAASPGIIHPLDFNSVTNAKVWQSVG